MGLNRIQNAALTVGAVLGSLCLLAALAAVLFGIKPLIFTSGSMDPTIPTGGLALSIPVEASDIGPGDIVSTENSSGTRITHRVVAVEPAAGYAQLTLQGDANDVADAEAYPVTEADRVFWSAPLLGYAVAWLSSPVAVFVGGFFTAYLLYVAFGVKRGPRRAPSTAGVATAGVLLLAGGALYGGALHGAEPASAAFTSKATAAASFSTASLPAPSQPVCSIQNPGGSGPKILLEWSDAGPVSAYSVRVDGGPAVQTTVRSILLDRASATVTVQAGYRGWTSTALRVNVQNQGQGMGGSVTCTVL